MLEKNGLVDAYIRPVAWRGSEELSVPARNNKVHLAIAAWVWPSYFSVEEKLKGIRLEWSKWKRPSPETIPSSAKAAGLYMICTLSKDAAMANGYADALMLDYRGYVAEATGANVFFIKGKDIVTPLPDCFLNGIDAADADRTGQAQWLHGDRTAHQAGRAEPVRRVLPDRHRGGSDAGVAGRRVQVHAGRGLPHADRRL